MRRALAVACALLLPVAVALAATPSQGTWTGSTSRPAPVSFRVLKDRSAMRRFRVGSDGPPPSGVRLRCSKKPGDYIDSEFVARKGGVDAIPVDGSGHFQARYDTSGKISRGTLKVTGRFKSKHSAAGTLSWKVKTRKGNHTCKSGNVHFTAHNP
jgi:hypothetical protein